MVERFIGRFAVMDGTARRVTDEARKTHVASFHGDHFSCEAEDGAMKVYAITDENGNPAQKFGGVEGTSGIRSSFGRDANEVARTGPRNPSELNILNRSGIRSVGGRDASEVAHTGPRTLRELNALNGAVRGELRRHRA